MQEKYRLYRRSNLAVFGPLAKGSRWFERKGSAAKRKKRPRPRPSSTLRALKWLSNPENAAMMLEWVRSMFRGQGTRLEIIPRLGSGFRVLAKRWIVERTFAWLGTYRRLAKDYEVKPKHSEAFIYAASTRLMLRRLASTKQ